MSCSENRELMPLYVTDALDAAEREAVCEHLDAGCPRCVGYLAEAEATIALLPLALPPADLTPELRQRMLARLESRKQLQSVNGAAASSGRSLRQAWSGSWVIPLLSGMAAAFAITVAISVPWVTQQRVVLADAEEQLEGRDRAESRLRTVLAQQRRSIRGIESPLVQVASLRATPLGSAAAIGRIFLDPAGDNLRLVVAHLPPVGPDRRYQVWLINRDEVKIASRTFNVEPDGTCSVMVSIPPAARPLAMVVVTDEPSAASPSSEPTGGIRLLGKLE